MKLKDIVSDLEYKLINGDLETEVSEISYDSRQIEENNLFIAISGFEVDGHNYIKQAVEKGASAVVIEKDLEEYNPDVSYIKVKNSRKAMAELAKSFFADPLEDIKLIGITGTNGKTTTSFLLYNILRDYAGKAALFGTIKNIIDGEEVSASRTTPESLDLYRYFSKMRKKGVEYAVMEVSSHALDLHRVRGMNFSAAIFTNLSPEHLDYHKNLDNYREVKSRLFSNLQSSSFAVINKDDQSSEYILERSAGRNYFYSLKNKNSDLYCREFNLSKNGMNYKSGGLIAEEFNLSLGGVFNIYNSLAAILTAHLLGAETKVIKKSLRNIAGVPGRFEIINAGQDFQIVVDYAHTPDGMENVLKTAAKLAKKRIIVLFGCGGDRDRSKRPAMAELAEKFADYAVVSNDNPRTEDPKKIFSEITAGFSKDFNDYEVIADRAEGINRAISLAEKDDIVMLLGRGHEKYQILNNKKIELDDRKVAYQAAEKRKE